MTLDLSKLNAEQKEAVTYGSGPLLIVAGAGTGKTTVIAQRIAYLIDKKLALPEEILAVTFTDKAAGELEDRVDQLLPYGYVDLWVSTFHSFCERVLRDHALDIGLPADFKILSQSAGWLLFRQNLEKLNLDYYKPLGNPTKFIQSLISHFSHCKDQGIYPEDYLAYAKKLKTRDDAPEESEAQRIFEVANAYHAYQNILLENSSLDFGDLINYCLKLFKKRPLILKKYKEQFKYVLVDEFQDTNWAQYELIKIIVEPKNNVTVCADDDQAIYRWRGASFSNIIQFKKDFPEASQISLVKNYRSSQNILDLAYNFIKANDPDRLEFVNKINKKLIAETSATGIIEHIQADTLEHEVAETIRKISDIIKREKKANFSDFAILVRANDAANPFIKALERAKIPYQFLASRGLYSKPCILDIISYFRLLDNYHESPAVYRILNLPFLEMPYEDIVKLTQYSHKKTKSLYEALQEIALIPEVSKKARETIGFILALITKHTQEARKSSVSEILLGFLEGSGYLKYLVEKDDKDQIDLLNQFYKRVKSFEESSLEPTLKNFVEELNLEIESGEDGKLEFDPEVGPEMVKVMTIHGAKGLEFKYVFVVNMVDKRFPTSARGELIELPEDLIKDIKPTGDVHLQEERRLCYVAMTRAKRELYLTSSHDYGGARKKKISRFLVEMGFKDDFESQPGESDILKKKETVQNSHSVAPEYLPERFSFSQLAAFEKCPLQYKFNFILKVPIKGKSVFSFGKTMHATLYDFLKYAQDDNKETQDNLFGFKDIKAGAKKKPLGLDLLKKIYEKNWIGEWYTSKDDQEAYYSLGKKIIKDFAQAFEKNPPKIMHHNGALALEIPFHLKLEGNTIYGVIDRIDQLDNGVEIIDYKTGNSKDKLDASAKEQLLIYQIAAEEVFKVIPKELTYFYLNDGQKQSFIGNEKEKQKLKEKILSQIKEIKTGKFNPTPGWQCAFCDFKDICDFSQA